MNTFERFKRLHEMLMDHIQAGRADAAYWVAVALHRIVTPLWR